MGLSQFDGDAGGSQARTPVVTPIVTPAVVSKPLL
jgi:hypothetical protein